MNRDSFYTHNDERFEGDEHWGTSLQGYIDIDYEELVEFFGEPMDAEYKVDAQWILVFEDGSVATIYNYKDGPNYLGEDAGMLIDSWADITEKNRDWHIGGNDGTMVARVRRILDL